jgi:hypothetical protein
MGVFRAACQHVSMSACSLSGACQHVSTLRLRLRLSAFQLFVFAEEPLARRRVGDSR